MLHRRSFQRAISLLVLVSTFMLHYQAFAHTHIDGAGLPDKDHVVVNTLDSAADVSDIFSLETAQGNCHIFSHLIGDSSEARAICEPVSQVLASTHNNHICGLSNLPPPPPPKL